MIYSSVQISTINNKNSNNNNNNNNNHGINNNVNVNVKSNSIINPQQVKRRGGPREGAGRKRKNGPKALTYTPTPEVAQFLNSKKQSNESIQQIITRCIIEYKLLETAEQRHRDEVSQLWSQIFTLEQDLCLCKQELKEHKEKYKLICSLKQNNKNSGNTNVLISPTESSSFSTMDSFFNESSLMNVKTSTPISSIHNSSFCNENGSSHSEYDSTPTKSNKNNIMDSSFDQGQNDGSPNINRNMNNNNNNNCQNTNYKMFNEPEDITDNYNTDNTINNDNNFNDSDNKINDYSSKYSVSSTIVSSQTSYQNMNENNKFYEDNINNNSLSSSPINKNKTCSLENNNNYYQIPSNNKNSIIDKLSSSYNTKEKYDFDAQGINNQDKKYESMMNQKNNSINNDKMKSDNIFDNNNKVFGGMATYNSERTISKSQKNNNQYKLSNYSSSCRSSTDSLNKKYYENNYYEERSSSSYDFQYKHKCNEKPKNDLENNCYHYELQQEQQYSNHLKFKKLKLDSNYSKNNDDEFVNNSSDYDCSSSCYNNNNSIKNNYNSSFPSNTMTIENLLVQLKNSNNNN